MILPTSCSRPAVVHHLDARRVPPQPGGDGAGELGDPALMTGGVGIAQLGRGAERGHRGRQRLP